MMPGVVWTNAKKEVELVTSHSDTVIFLRMILLLRGPGTCKNHYIYVGNNSIARVTAGTIA